MNRSGRLVLGALLVLGLTACTTLLAEHAATGTDDQAVEQIGALTDGSYKSWIASPGIPGGEQNEPILFGVQAGAGLAVLAGCLWYWREHRSGA